MTTVAGGAPAPPDRDWTHQAIAAVEADFDRAAIEAFLDDGA